MGLVNVRYRPGRASPWRAQWREGEGAALVSREKWFPGPPPPADQPEWMPEEVARFKAQHEQEGPLYDALAVSATDRARWWALNQQCKAAGLSIEQAVAAGIEAVRRRAARSERLEAAREAWALDAEFRKLRQASIASMKQAVGAFAEGREAAMVDELRPADLLQWVAARYRDQGSRDDMLGRLLTFFRWCAAEPRKWCDKGEWSGVKFEHRVKGEKKRIGFYSRAEAAALLHAIDDGLKPALALGFFTGLRPFEMQRVQLTWRWKGEVYGFDAQRGEWHIAAEWAKTRAYRRLYDLPDCWWYWWIGYKDAIKPDRRQRKRNGYLVPMNYRNFRAALARAREACGIRRAPKDGIRHSFGTHGFHRSADGKARGVEWCIALMGHVGGYRVFETSYNGKVSSADAEGFFGIYPEGAACEVKTRARVIVDGATGAIVKRGPAVPAA